MCYICDKTTNADDVCKKCRGIKDLYISKTAAKNDHMMHDEDLVGLYSFDVVSRMYGRSGQVITLYIRVEVEAKAFAKDSINPPVIYKPNNEKGNAEKIARETLLDGIILNNGGNKSILMNKILKRFINVGFNKRSIKNPADGIAVAITDIHELETYVVERIERVKGSVSRFNRLEAALSKDNIRINVFTNVLAALYIKYTVGNVQDIVQCIKKSISWEFEKKFRKDSLEEVILREGLIDVRRPQKCILFSTDSSYKLDDVITTMKMIQFFSVKGNYINDDKYLLQLVRKHIDDGKSVIDLPFEVYMKYMTHTKIDRKRVAAFPPPYVEEPVQNTRNNKKKQINKPIQQKQEKIRKMPNKSQPCDGKDCTNPSAVECTGNYCGLCCNDKFCNRHMKTNRRKVKVV